MTWVQLEWCLQRRALPRVVYWVRMVRANTAQPSASCTRDSQIPTILTCPGLEQLWEALRQKSLGGPWGGLGLQCPLAVGALRSSLCSPLLDGWMHQKAHPGCWVQIKMLLGCSCWAQLWVFLSFSSPLQMPLSPLCKDIPACLAATLALSFPCCPVPVLAALAREDLHP